MIHPINNIGSVAEGGKTSYFITSYFNTVIPIEGCCRMLGRGIGGQWGLSPQCDEYWYDYKCIFKGFNSANHSSRKLEVFDRKPREATQYIL